MQMESIPRFHVWINLLNCFSIQFCQGKSVAQSDRTESTISGFVPQNQRFFHREISVHPSISATVSYNITTANNGPVFDLFTGDSQASVNHQCSLRALGQMANRKLHLYLKTNENGCRTSNHSTDLLECSGEIRVLDYTPRIFSFSLGFPCGHQKSLRNVTFDVGIIEKNVTECLSFPEKEKTCSKLFSSVAFPNLIGDDSFSDLYGRLSRALDRSLERLQHHDVPPSDRMPCYKYYFEAVCFGLYPNCNSKAGTILPACRETCVDAVNGCRNNPVYGRDFFLLNCNYLPSVFGNIPCFYDNVTCGDPPDVPNAHLITNHYNASSGDNFVVNLFSNSYPVHSEFEYSCTDETFSLEGNHRISVNTVASGPNLQNAPKYQAMLAF